MRYLLDTNICIYALNRSDEGLSERFRSVSRADLRVSSITVAELLYGAANSARAEENVKRVARFLAPLGELPFDRKAAQEYAPMRAGLVARGRQVSSADMFIAATALAHRLTVVTNDKRAFERVAGLQVVDWATRG